MSEPEPCPLGTYSNTTGLRRISDCNACDPGSYCDQRGLTSPTAPCDPGFYCLDGSYTSAPNAPGSPLSIEDVEIGGLCPGGFMAQGQTGVWCTHARESKTIVDRYDSICGNAFVSLRFVTVRFFSLPFVSSPLTSPLANCVFLLEGA